MTDPGTRSHGTWTWEGDYLPMWQALWGIGATKTTDEQLAERLGRSVKPRSTDRPCEVR